MGESAGAMSVAAHLALDRSAHLFSQAVVMSGNDDSLPLTRAVQAGERFASVVGCGDSDRQANLTNLTRLECLRGLDSWKLINEQAPVYNGSMRALQVPVADDYELPVGRCAIAR